MSASYTNRGKRQGHFDKTPLSCVLYLYMNESKQVLADLKKAGCRMTQLRQGMVTLFCSTDKPVSAAEVMMTLLKQGISVNKTSVYRELQFLEQQGVIKTVLFSAEEARYERAGEHHHHVVCRKCNTVQDIHAEGVEDALSGVERSIGRGNHFSEVSHSLEFFGLCNKCT